MMINTYGEVLKRSVNIYTHSWDEVTTALKCILSGVSHICRTYCGVVKCDYKGQSRLHISNHAGLISHKLETTKLISKHIYTHIG